MSTHWPTWLDEVWAKAPAESGKPGESLASHTYRVLEKLRQMIDFRPQLPDRLGVPGLWESLIWACWFHDFGKAARGFQQSLRGGARWPHRHEVLSLAFLNWIEGMLDPDQALWTAAAVAFHHKDLKEIMQLYDGPEEESTEVMESLLDEVDDRVLEGLWRWLGECTLDWLQELNLADYVQTRPVKLVPKDEVLWKFRTKGVAYIRDRLRMLRCWYGGMDRRGQEAVMVSVLVLHGHLVTCDHTASAGTRVLLPAPVQDRKKLLGQWGLSEANLYSHQSDCLRVVGEAVVVAPTGSGKTEAALLWACAQSGNNKPLPRLFYVLPYQASMNAMYDRLRKSFPGAVGLEHGRSMLALYRRFLEDSGDRHRSMRLARSAQALSRLHYFPVRILSPYQLLKGPYQLKGYEALLTDFFEAAFVFDEVHAYEARRLAAILATVSYLRRFFSARFLVMSATLPRLLKARLAKALGSDLVVRASPEVFAQFRRHRLLFLDGDLLAEEYLEQMVRDARKGSSVLVCCNTVKRAQRVYGELCLRLRGVAEVVLLHGRFNSRDRLQKERLVLQASGARSAVRRPIVLVATQVVEVSLDIDLDVIYSDPAPLDALVQRFGRVNRRRLRPWAPVYVFAEPADGQGVYEPGLVQATLNVIRKNAGNLIDEEAISEWLEEVYCGEAATQWNKDYDDEYASFEVSCLQTLKPFGANPHLEEMFYQAFNGTEVLPADLEDDFNRCMAAGEPLEAAQLLVSVTWGRYTRLRQEGLVRSGCYPWIKIVESPYNSEIGLG
jgi:CRISPR-associated endonuclease/helicase Cas3